MQRIRIRPGGPDHQMQLSADDCTSSCMCKCSCTRVRIVCALLESSFRNEHFQTRGVDWSAGVGSRRGRQSALPTASARRDGYEGPGSNSNVSLNRHQRTVHVTRRSAQRSTPRACRKRCCYCCVVLLLHVVTY